MEGNKGKNGGEKGFKLVLGLFGQVGRATIH